MQSPTGIGGRRTQEEGVVGDAILRGGGEKVRDRRASRTQATKKAWGGGSQIEKQEKNGECNGTLKSG